MADEMIVEKWWNVICGKGKREKPREKPTQTSFRTPRNPHGGTEMRTRDPAGQVDSFKYLGCNISSNMNCCQEVKQRIAMATEAFNRKRSIFCGPLEKEPRRRLVKCFVWSVAFYGAETWTLDGMSKSDWKNLRCGYGEGWSV